MAGLDDAASELESIARHLREIGDTELIRELTRRMRDAAATVPDQVRQGLAPHLPNRYAATLDGDLRIGTSVRTNDRNPGVSLTGTARPRRGGCGPSTRAGCPTPSGATGSTGGRRRSRRAGSPGRRRTPPRRSAPGSTGP